MLACALVVPACVAADANSITDEVLQSGVSAVAGQRVVRDAGANNAWVVASDQAPTSSGRQWRVTGSALGYLSSDVQPQLLLLTARIHPSTPEPACQLSILEPTVKDQHLAWSTIALSADDSAWYCAAIEALERDSSGRDRLALSACVLTVDGHLARAARSLSIRDGVASVRDVDATSSECQGCASGL